MVRPLSMVLAAILAAICVPSGAVAQGLGADWQRAGGALFALPDPALPSSSLSVPADGQAADADARLTSPEQPFGQAIAEAAQRHGIDPKLLHALVVVESAYRQTACSSAGACGLTQLMPATAREVGVTDRFEPLQNLRGGADYLARQLLRFGDVRLALAAYNAGPGRVARLGRIPAIPETQAYVTMVVDCYLALTAGRAIRTARDCSVGDRS